MLILYAYADAKGKVMRLFRIQFKIVELFID